MKPRVLVACVGNIFLGDDGFGVEVARRLAEEPLPDWVRVKDFGIRGVHLAYELLDGYETLVLVDATPRGDLPGTVYVIEADTHSYQENLGDGVSIMDAHGMEPGSVFAFVESLGGRAGRVLVVGCEPADVSEGIGLSEPATQAVDQAVEVIRDLIVKEQGDSGSWAGGLRSQAEKGGMA